MMKKDPMENRLRRACTGLAPDVLDAVLSDCEEWNGAVIMMPERKIRML